MKEKTDQEIIESCLAGDNKSWEYIISRYGKIIYGTARYGFRFEHEIAEEIVQEIYIEILHKLPDLTDDKLKSFIYYRTKSRCIDEYRKRKALKRGGGAVTVSSDEEYDDGEIRNPVPDDTPGPEPMFLKEEIFTYLRNALQMLNVACQKILLLRFDEELSLVQIANRLKEREQTITSRLYRCLNSLNKILIKTYGPMEGIC